MKILEVDLYDVNQRCKEENLKIYQHKSQGQRKKRTNIGTNKVFKKVKEKAKKIKNNHTKLGHGHGHYNDHDVYEEEYGKQESEWHVYTYGGVTGQPESLCHPGEAYFQAPPKIVPPGTKDFPLVSSDQTKRPEPEPLRDTFYGHERIDTLERE